MIPRRPSVADARALDALVRYRAALDAWQALAERLDVEDLDGAGALAEADRELLRATRALREHLERSALVFRNVVYLADGRGGVASTPVRVLDGRVAARLPGLGVS